MLKAYRRLLEWVESQREYSERFAWGRSWRAQPRVAQDTGCSPAHQNASLGHGSDHFHPNWDK